MNKSPFFSIITSSYNSQATIRATIQSVLDLDFLDYEYLIIDGNSSDNTMKIVKEFEPLFIEKGVSYHYISEPDAGIYDAWNKGVQISSGQWIGFIGSDDLFLKHALSSNFKKIMENPEANFISAKINLVNAQGKILNVVGKPYVWENIITNFDVAVLASFFNKSLFDELGLFDTSYRIVGDLDFFFRTKDKINPLYFDQVTVNMLTGGASNQIKKALKEALLVKQKYGYTSKVNHYIMYYNILFRAQVNRLLNRN